LGDQKNINIETYNLKQIIFYAPFGTYGEFA